MRALHRCLLVSGAWLCSSRMPAAEPDVIYLSCKVKPSIEYNVRIERLAEVMWVDGNRLKLNETETEFRAIEYSGEPTELKAEYRINRTSLALQRISYGLNGALGKREGVCKVAEKPAVPKPVF